MGGLLEEEKRWLWGRQRRKLRLKEVWGHTQGQAEGSRDSPGGSLAAGPGWAGSWALASVISPAERPVGAFTVFSGGSLLPNPRHVLKPLTLRKGPF